MKKKAFPLLAVLFFVTSSAFGQLNEFGIKVGGQSAGAFSEQNEFSRVAGFGIYFFADFGLNQTLFTTLDLGYTQRGFTDSFNKSAYSYKNNALMLVIGLSLYYLLT